MATAKYPGRRMRRRDLLAAAMLTATCALGARQLWAAGPRINVYRTSGCACCLAWASNLRQAGFEVTTTDLAMGQLMRMKLDAGLKPEHASCHTAKIDGFTIEGHVPVREIRRLLAERPDATGLAVPGMPLGSPGMEAGSRIEAYDVLLFRADGSTEVYARYPTQS